MLWLLVNFCEIFPLSLFSLEIQIFKSVCVDFYSSFLDRVPSLVKFVYCWKLISQNKKLKFIVADSPKLLSFLDYQTVVLTFQVFCLIVSILRRIIESINRNRYLDITLHIVFYLFVLVLFNSNNCRPFILDSLKRKSLLVMLGPVFKITTSTTD